MKLKNDPSSKPVVNDNLLEIVCRDCTRRSRREMEKSGLTTNFRIIHCFAFDGQFVESLREPVE